MHTILAKKVRMSQTFEGNVRMPVTILEAGPCVVTQIKSTKVDGYSSVQLGFKENTKATSKPLQGHFKKSITEDNKKTPKYLKEARFTEDSEVLEKYALGSTILVDAVLAKGDMVSVTGISKGKGFQGGVKRHGFAGGPKTHGQSDRHRAPGSIGQGTDPGRVHKGKRMAGHMGDIQVTVKNLEVLEVHPEKNELWLKGPVPGANGSILVIRKSEK